MIASKPVKVFVDFGALNHYSTPRFLGSPFTCEPTPRRRFPLYLRLTNAQVAELVDALASGASEQLARGGSSPLLGTSFKKIITIKNQEMKCPACGAFFSF